MLTPSSDPDSLPVKLVLPLLRTLHHVGDDAASVARLAEVENKSALSDVSRCLHFLHLPKICEAALQATATLARDAKCQRALAATGAVWHAAALMTRYDFTLDEAMQSGVEADGDSNVTASRNHHAQPPRVTACV